MSLENSLKEQCSQVVNSLFHSQKKWLILFTASVIGHHRSSPYCRRQQHGCHCLTKCLPFSSGYVLMAGLLIGTLFLGGLYSSSCWLGASCKTASGKWNNISTLSGWSVLEALHGYLLLFTTLQCFLPHKLSVIWLKLK